MIIREEETKVSLSHSLESSDCQGLNNLSSVLKLSPPVTTTLSCTIDIFGSVGALFLL